MMYILVYRKTRDAHLPPNVMVGSYKFIDSLVKDIERVSGYYEFADVYYHDTGAFLMRVV